MSRAQRRHHARRLKRKRAKYWGGGDLGPRYNGVRYTSPQCQSNCMCCMNQRKLYGATRQERLSEIKQKEQEQEIGLPKTHRMLSQQDWQTIHNILSGD